MAAKVEVSKDDMAEFIRLAFEQRGAAAGKKLVLEILTDCEDQIADLNAQIIQMKKIVLTPAQKSVLIDCAEFVLAGEWPEEWEHKPEILQGALEKLRDPRA